MYTKDKKDWRKPKLLMLEMKSTQGGPGYETENDGFSPAYS